MDCAGCGAAFPVIDGIPVLTSRPLALISSHVQFMDGFAERVAGVAGARVSLNAECRPRAAAAVTGILHNRNLGARIRSVMAASLTDVRQAADIVDVLAAVNVGWTFEQMLPYFYQDWSRDGGLSAVSDRITTALAQHCDAGAKVVLLGAGACGLLRDVAGRFRDVVGLDLSLPTFLLAGRLLAGESVDVALSRARWQSVRLNGSAPVHAPQLAVGDANRIPFAAGSVSAIVTQYLMDIVRDPFVTAREINRVLKSGGVWINFSNPFALPRVPLEYGPVALDELPALLGDVGFRVMHAENCRFDLLDTRMICAESVLQQHVAHFFVARKARNEDAETKQWASSCDERWWDSVVARVASPFCIVEQRRVGVMLDRSVVQMEIAGRKRSARVPLSPDHVAVLDCLFSGLEHPAPVRHLYERIRSMPCEMPVNVFQQLLDCLQFDYAAIVVQPK